MSSLYGGLQGRKPTSDGGPAGGRKGLTVIGPAKKNKLPFSGSETLDDAPEEDPYFFARDKEAMLHQAQQYGRGGMGPGMPPLAGPRVGQPHSYNNRGPMPPPHSSPGPTSPRQAMGFVNGGGMRMPSQPPPGRMPMGGGMQGMGGGHDGSWDGGGFSGGARGGMPQQYPPQDFMVGGMPLGKPRELDMSNFPALNQHGQLGNGGGMGGMMMVPGSPSAGAYSSLSKSKSPKQEFNMQQDEFPALPGAKASKSPDMSPGSPLSGGNPGGPHGKGLSVAGLGPGPAPGQMPPSAVTPPMLGQPRSPEDNPEKYGVLGLLNVTRMDKPDLNMLALGSDLTTLGLNLNSPDVLYPTFASPWAEQPLRPREPAFSLPPCYAVKTSSVPMKQRITQFKDETLFFIFYSCAQDVMQQAAAAVLYSRDWRFHKERSVWITRSQGQPTQKTPTSERGTYIVFDVNTWKKVPKEMELYYEMLEDQRKTGPPAPGPAN